MNGIELTTTPGFLESWELERMLKSYYKMDLSEEIKDGRDTICINKPAAAHGKTFYSNFKPNTQYKFSAETFQGRNASGIGARFIFKYTDGTTQSLSGSNNIWTTINYITPIDKSVEKLYVGYGVTEKTYFTKNTLRLEEV